MERDWLYGTCSYNSYTMMFGTWGLLLWTQHAVQFKYSHTHTYILQLYLLTKQRVKACYEICLFYLCNIPEQDYQVVLKIHSINLPSK